MDFETDVKRKGVISEIIRRLSDLETKIRKILAGGTGGAVPVVPTLYRIVLGAQGEEGTIPAGATRYLRPFQATLSTLSFGLSWPVSGTLLNCFLAIGSAQPATGSLVCTLKKNGVATAIVITIPAGSAAGTYSDTTHTDTFVGGAGLRWDIVNNAAAASASIRFISLEERSLLF